ncbi:hypothetical protein F4803DRAFT_251465 [Xylaria telfairii]|nr:hypothetical protein F4803DRAFT_251465 [Xylaria telfairii]
MPGHLLSHSRHRCNFPYNPPRLVFESAGRIDRRPEGKHREMIVLQKAKPGPQAERQQSNTAARGSRQFIDAGERAHRTLCIRDLTISIRRRRDAEAALCGEKARGAAVGRELRRDQILTWDEAWEARLRWMFGYGSKRLSRSIDQSTNASTLTLWQPGPEQARDGWTENDAASIGRITTRGPVSAVRRGALGVPSWVMKGARRSGALDRSTLDPIVETTRTATTGANRLPDLVQNVGDGVCG